MCPLKFLLVVLFLSLQPTFTSTHVFFFFFSHQVSLLRQRHLHSEDSTKRPLRRTFQCRHHRCYHHRRHACICCTHLARHSTARQMDRTRARRRVQGDGEKGISTDLRRHHAARPRAQAKGAQTTAIARSSASHVRSIKVSRSVPSVSCLAQNLTFWFNRALEEGQGRNGVQLARPARSYNHAPGRLQPYQGV